MIFSGLRWQRKISPQRQRHSYSQCHADDLRKLSLKSIQRRSLSSWKTEENEKPGPACANAFPQLGRWLPATVILSGVTGQALCPATSAGFVKTEIDTFEARTSGQLGHLNFDSCSFGQEQLTGAGSWSGERGRTCMQHQFFRKAWPSRLTCRFERQTRVLAVETVLFVWAKSSEEVRSMTRLLWVQACARAEVERTESSLCQCDDAHKKILLSSVHVRCAELLFASSMWRRRPSRDLVDLGRLWMQSWASCLVFIADWSIAESTDETLELLVLRKRVWSCSCVSSSFTSAVLGTWYTTDVRWQIELLSRVCFHGEHLVGACSQTRRTNGFFRIRSTCDAYDTCARIFKTFARPSYTGFYWVSNYTKRILPFGPSRPGFAESLFLWTVPRSLSLSLSLSRCRLLDPLAPLSSKIFLALVSRRCFQSLPTRTYRIDRPFVGLTANSMLSGLRQKNEANRSSSTCSPLGSCRLSAALKRCRPRPSRSQFTTSHGFADDSKSLESFSFGLAIEK